MIRLRRLGTAGIFPFLLFLKLCIGFLFGLNKIPIVWIQGSGFPLPYFVLLA